MGKPVPNYCEFLVCLTVCQLAYFLTLIIQIQGYIQFWMRCHFEMFWRHSWDNSAPVPNIFKFSSLSACQLAYFLNKIKPIQGYLLFWRRYVFETLWRHSWDIFSLFPNNFKFLVCLSVCQLAHILIEIRPIQKNLLFWMRYLSETCWRQSWDVCTPFPNKCNFFA